MTTRRSRILLLTVLAALIAALVARAWFSEPAGNPSEVSGESLVREDSHVLSQAPAEEAVLVEFLDFECESCRAFYPTVEELRAEFASELTVVLRYFPIPSHTNAQNAALAVEAASRQGQLEAMYKMMYATQGEWGEAQESKAQVFRGFADELGLDLAQYDQDVADPATLERVTRDFDDGLALGVSGTPTFFLDGEKVTANSPDELRAAVEAALDQ
jgi:protein-disulfide isomerase